MESPCRDCNEMYLERLGVKRKVRLKECGIRFKCERLKDFQISLIGNDERPAVDHTGGDYRLLLG